jgi:hypothetical protein
MTNKYGDIVLRTFRMINLKLSRARYAIKQIVSSDCHVSFVRELSEEPAAIETRTIISVDRFPELNMSLRSHDLEFFVEKLVTLYRGDVDNIEEDIDTLFRYSTGETPLSISEEDMVKESISAMLKKLDSKPLLYTEYSRAHPNFHNGISLSETDFVLSCKKAGLFQSGSINEDILKNYSIDIEKLSDSIKNLR